jgi:hypothetical protein
MYRRHTLVGRAARFMLILALCAGWTASGEAAPVTFTFTGEVNLVSTSPGDPFSGGIGLGTTFSGQITFESTTPDLLPDLPLGAFTSPAAAPYGFSVTIGNFAFSNSGSLGVYTNNGANGDDRFLAQACADGPGCYLLLGLGLFDYDGTALGSDALPVTPPSLADFEIAQFSLGGVFNGNWAYVFGDLQSFACGAGCEPASTPVPEPGTLGMVGLAVSRLIGRRARPGARPRRNQA